MVSPSLNRKLTLTAWVLLATRITNAPVSLTFAIAFSGAAVMVPNKVGDLAADSSAEQIALVRLWIYWDVS